MAPPPVPPEAVLFDWDMTLVDNWRTVRRALNAALTGMGKDPWTMEQTRARVRESMRDSFPRMFGDRWTEARDIFLRSFRSHHLTGLRPLPGAESALRALREEGCFLGVVSNKQGDFLRAEIDHLGWRDHFGAVVGAADAPRDKPARDPVDLALSAGGLAPGPRVWFVGDTGIDMACARAAGCVAVLIGGADPAAAEFAAAPPAHHVPDFAALLVLVRSVRKAIS
jgi:phosphoglycolate phosphatase